MGANSSEVGPLVIEYLTRWLWSHDSWDTNRSSNSTVGFSIMRDEFADTKPFKNWTYIHDLGRLLTSVSQTFDVLSTVWGRKYVCLDVIQNTAHQGSETLTDLSQTWYGWLRPWHLSTYQVWSLSCSVGGLGAYTNCVYVYICHKSALLCQRFDTIEWASSSALSSQKNLIVAGVRR